jgi:biopolymer transport protein ExbD
MKLHSYLPKPGASLYLAPLLNGVLLLLIFFLLGSTFVIQSGIGVRLPESPSRLSGFDRAHVITVASSPENPYDLDGKPTALEELKKELAQKKREMRKLIIHADQMAPFGRVMEISNAALGLGFEIAYATQPPRNF